MSNDPTSVPLAKVLDFFADLGLDPIDPNNLRSVHFDPGVLTVERFRCDGDGNRIALETGNDSTETVTIRIVA